MSAKKRMVLQSATIVTLCIILIMLIGYNKMRDVLLENRIQFYTESMKLQSQNTAYFKRLIENITDYSINVPAVTNSLSSGTFNAAISNNLSDLRSINLDIIGSTIYSFNGLHYESNNIYSFPSFSTFSRSKEYKEFEKESEDQLWLLCTDDISTYKYTGSKSTDVISYMTRISANSSSVGIAIINIATPTFMKYFMNDPFNSDFALSLFVPDKKLFIPVGNKKTDIPYEEDAQALISSGKDYMLSKDANHLILSQKILNESTYVIKIISLTNFYAEANKLKIYFICVAVILPFVLISLYNRLARSIFSPLIALHNKMIKYRD
jgi:hypothetical protein